MKGIAIGAAVVGALALTAAPAHAQASIARAPRFGAPSVVGGRVVWSAPTDSVPAWARGLVMPPVTSDDSLALWTRAARETLLHDIAAYRLGALWLASGDSVRADSCWRTVRDGAIWRWPALRGRADFLLARGDTARADSLLEREGRDGWSDADRAEWLERRIRLRAALGDTTQALKFAKQSLRAYPRAGAALALLDTLLARSRQVLGPDDLLQAAGVERNLRGSSKAADRLARALPALSPRERGDLTREWAQQLRLARRFDEAEAAAREAIALARDPFAVAEGWLESARVAADRGARDSARVRYSRVVAWAPDPELRRVGELGSTVTDAVRAERDARWEDALAGWVRAAASLTDRRSWQRAGLMALAAGRQDSACALFARDSSDACRFWWGVTRRALGDRAAGDSALRLVATRPGYSFHRAAARDTLGLAGWPGTVNEPCQPESACAPLALPHALLAIGAFEEASVVLARWSRAVQKPGRDAPGWRATRVGAADIAFAAGRPGQGIGMATTAAEQAGDARADSAAWAAWAWAFPPAWESLFVASRDTAVAALEPALLFALTYQESRFDPRARSRSDALGLMQLKLVAASDVAGWLRHPKPTEATLFDPAINVSYGARYLARLIRRFDGSIAAALLAYNAGPGAMPPWWREAIARGGEALLCELASNGDYARRILGYRQAYRELRPTAYAR